MKRFMLIITLLTMLVVAGCSVTDMVDTSNAMQNASGVVTEIVSSPIVPIDWKMTALSVAGGLSLLGNAIQAYANKKTKTALKEVVQGVELVRDELHSDDYDKKVVGNQRSAQSPATKKRVDRIRKNYDTVS